MHHPLREVPTDDQYKESTPVPTDNNSPWHAYVAKPTPRQKAPHPSEFTTFYFSDDPQSAPATDLGHIDEVKRSPGEAAMTTPYPPKPIRVWITRKCLFESHSPFPKNSTDLPSSSTRSEPVEGECGDVRRSKLICYYVRVA